MGLAGALIGGRGKPQHKRPTTAREQLAVARWYVAESDRLIAEQRAIIRRLREIGAPTALEESLLFTMAGTRAIYQKYLALKVSPDAGEAPE
jgi:hypothetical protein